jgi:hypothetical protein
MMVGEGTVEPTTSTQHSNEKTMSMLTNLLKPVLAASVAVAAMSGCASTGSGTAPARSSDVITQEELIAYVGDDLHLVIRRLRPQWTRPRTGRTMTQQIDVSLVVDGMRWHNLTRLREISVADVAEVRFLDALDATTRFGSDMAGGAIIVVRKGGR